MIVNSLCDYFFIVKNEIINYNIKKPRHWGQLPWKLKDSFIFFFLYYKTSPLVLQYKNTQRMIKI